MLSRRTQLEYLKKLAARAGHAIDLTRIDRAAWLVASRRSNAGHHEAVTREGRLWNEFVARYHYLGYKTLVGAQMRYAVHDRNGWPVAMLGFSTAAWKLAPRDNFIGWTPDP